MHAEVSPGPNGLSVRQLGVDYRSPMGYVAALRDVSLRLVLGESLCLIGRSGSGKSTCLRALGGLLPESTRVSGAVWLPSGVRLDAMDSDQLRSYRRDHLGVIFQDAVGSLVPGVAVGKQLERAFRYRRRLPATAVRDQALRALRRVGFVEPESSWRKPPSALSGGMAQRVMIALALAAPALDVLLADEPVASLDAVSASRVLDLLFEVQREEQACLMCVSHDARIARRFDWVGVLEQGRLVEFRRSAEFMAAQQSTQGRELLEASRALG